MYEKYFKVHAKDKREHNSTQKGQKVNTMITYCNFDFIVKIQ